jgi:hypothetical protein
MHLASQQHNLELEMAAIQQMRLKLRDARLMQFPEDGWHDQRVGANRVWLSVEQRTEETHQ